MAGSAFWPFGADATYGEYLLIVDDIFLKCKEINCLGLKVAEQSVRAVSSVAKKPARLLKAKQTVKYV